MTRFPKTPGPNMKRFSKILLALAALATVAAVAVEYYCPKCGYWQDAPVVSCPICGWEAK